MIRLGLRAGSGSMWCPLRLYLLVICHILTFVWFPAQACVHGSLVDTMVILPTNTHQIFRVQKIFHIVDYWPSLLIVCVGLVVGIITNYCNVLVLAVLAGVKLLNWSDSALWDVSYLTQANVLGSYSRSTWYCYSDCHLTTPPPLLYLVRPSTTYNELVKIILISNKFIIKYFIKWCMFKCIIWNW